MSSDSSFKWDKSNPNQTIQHNTCCSWTSGHCCCIPVPQLTQTNRSDWEPGWRWFHDDKKAQMLWKLTRRLRRMIAQMTPSTASSHFRWWILKIVRLEFFGNTLDNVVVVDLLVHNVHIVVNYACVRVRLVFFGNGNAKQTLQRKLSGKKISKLCAFNYKTDTSFLTLIWPLAMVMAAPEVKPAMTGWEMKSMRKPSLRLPQMKTMIPVKKASSGA